MLAWLQYRWTSLYLMLTALLTLALFLFGYFPLRYHTGKLADMDDLPNFINGISVDGQTVYDAGEHGVVLMVIDGLRYDFVTAEYMPFTSQLLKEKSACLYVSLAEPPTVTMPRIKSPDSKKEKAEWRRTINFWRSIYAMMTGTVSTFADVALNFGAQAVRGDSVPRAAHSRGRRLRFYGDDTWLRLFPGLWEEHDGVTSFYVTDYTEVDNNVTRHLDESLSTDKDKKPLFDLMVLHYLGLDHIGHLEGARSPKIKPKLLEMDEIVKKIFTAMQKWDRNGVLVVCGDHGMRDAGGHGGASPAEVLVPLVVAVTEDFGCPHVNSSGGVVSQTRLAPTLSWLLRAPAPRGSCAPLLPTPPPADHLQALYLLHAAAASCARDPNLPHDTEFYMQFERAEKLFGDYLVTGNRLSAKIAKEFYEESVEHMSQYLADTSVKFDMFAIITAILLFYCITMSLLCVTLYSLQYDSERKISITQHARYSKTSSALAFVAILLMFTGCLTIACFITETNSKICTFDPHWILVFMAICTNFTVCYCITKAGMERLKETSVWKDLNVIDYFLFCGTVFHAWSFFGTSFIEEEHMTWYFLWNTLMLFILVRTVVMVVLHFSKKLSNSTEVQEKPELDRKMKKVGFSILPKWLLIIGLHRYLRTMNQTGDRWLFLPDTADWLNAPENSFYLQLHLVVGTIATVAICLWNIRFMNNTMHAHTMFTIIATCCILSYRMATNSLGAPLEDIKTWNPITIVNSFWIILIAQGIFEIVTYLGIFKLSDYSNPEKLKSTFTYSKPKLKTEDIYESPDESSIDDTKLRLARSLSHVMFNDMMLTVILLMRPHNVIMVPSLYLTCALAWQCLDHKLLDSRVNRDTEIVDTFGGTLVHLWIGALFFFYQGNSNSLASVDLGAGYVGLGEYSAPRVAARMGLHAYAGPALAGAHLYCALADRAHTWRRYLEALWRATNIFALQRVYCLLLYCIICAIFKNHLFVWTVFSPKLLYEFVNTVFCVQAILTICEIVIIANATSWLARVIALKSKLYYVD